MIATIIAASTVASTNVTLFWILLVITFFVIFIVWMYYLGEKESKAKDRYKPWRHDAPVEEGAPVTPSYTPNYAKTNYSTTTVEKKPFEGVGIGSPLFGMDKKLAFNLDIGDKVWTLTPYGPFIFVISGVMNHEGSRYVMMANEGFSAVAKWDEEYLNKTIYERMGRVAGVWRLTDIDAVKLREKNTPEAQAANFRWIYQESDLGDFLDAIIWYHFIFEGFKEELETYQALEVQTVEWVPELALEDVLNQSEEQVLEETAEVEYIPAEEQPEDVVAEDAPSEPETDDVDFENIAEPESDSNGPLVEEPEEQKPDLNTEIGNFYNDSTQSGWSGGSWGDSGSNDSDSGSSDSGGWDDGGYGGGDD